MKRTRLTISIGANVISAVDDIIDGVHIRNRSHAIETLLSEGLNIMTIRTAVILAGGKEATKKIPAIEFSLKLLKENNIFDVKMAVGYLGEQIREKIGDGEKYSLNIEYIEGGQGTGGALLPLKNRTKDTFLVFNLEQPVNCDLKNLIKFHNEHKPIATIATKSLREPWGIYVFDPKIFTYIPKGFSLLEEEIFDSLTKEGNLLSYPVLT